MSCLHKPGVPAQKSIPICAETPRCHGKTERHNTACELFEAFESQVAGKVCGRNYLNPALAHGLIKMTLARISDK